MSPGPVPLNPSSSALLRAGARKVSLHVLPTLICMSPGPVSLNLSSCTALKSQSQKNPFPVLLTTAPACPLAQVSEPKQELYIILQTWLKSACPLAQFLGAESRNTAERERGQEVARKTLASAYSYQEGVDLLRYLLPHSPFQSRGHCFPLFSLKDTAFPLSVLRTFLPPFQS
jgi:hypothetical protein